MVSRQIRQNIAHFTVMVAWVQSEEETNKRIHGARRRMNLLAAVVVATNRPVESDKKKAKSFRTHKCQFLNSVFI